MRFVGVIVGVKTANTHLGAQILVLHEEVDHPVNNGRRLVQSDRHIGWQLEEWGNQ